MAEYIKKDVAIAKLTDLEVKKPLATMTDAKRVLADMPTADVVRCGHGYWMRTDEDIYECSRCHRDWVFNEETPEKMGISYCPCCGVKMVVIKRG